MFNLEHASSGRRRGGYALPRLPDKMNKQDQHREDVSFRVMRLLEENPQMTQRDLARALDISLGRVNYCMKALIVKGLIKTQNFRNSKDKLAYSYLLTPQGIAQKAALTSNFLKRKMQEFEALQAEIMSLRRDLGTSGPVAHNSDDSPTRPGA